MTPSDAVFLYLKHLRAMERWIDKTRENAAQRKFDADVLLAARLAPDQLPLSAQFQSACDSAKFGVTKLAGVEPPSHPDTEKTFEELRARINTAVSLVETFQDSDFAGWEERRVSHSWMGVKWIRASDYIIEFAVPNFLFHVTTAYSILRHNGVPLGKSDFIAPITMHG
jgi:hypothetical protein